MPAMTDAQLTKWGERYGITLGDVKDLQILIDLYGNQNEHYCNGDPHPRRLLFSKNKAKNSEAWERDAEQTGNRLETLAKRLGFDKVDFGVGLYPCLVKGLDTCIMVPSVKDDEDDE